MMKRLQILAVGILTCASLTVGCSRARVESLRQMNEGVELAARKQYTLAAEALQSAAAIDATNDQAYWNLAIVNIEMQRYEAARDALQRAIDVNGEVAGYYEKLGSVLMQLEQWNDARDAFQRAIEIESSLFQAHYKLAQVHERLGDQQEALSAYTEAIRQGPRMTEGYQALGGLYANVGFPELAARVLESGLEIAVDGSDDEARLHHLLGTVYQQQGNIDGAIEQFRAAHAVMPSAANTIFCLGWAYSMQDNRQDARRFLQRYVDTAGNDAPPHYLKAARDRLMELQEP